MLFLLQEQKESKSLKEKQGQLVFIKILKKTCPSKIFTPLVYNVIQILISPLMFIHPQNVHIMKRILYSMEQILIFNSNHNGVEAGKNK